MSEQLSRDTLQQHWMHSHEEDTDTEMVFRPAGYSFPRSRGRTSFDLKPDGTLIQGSIGPTDRRQETQSQWQLEDHDLIFYQDRPAEPSRVLQVASVDANRLVVKKK